MMETGMRRFALICGLSAVAALAAGVSNAEDRVSPSDTRGGAVILAPNSSPSVIGSGVDSTTGIPDSGQQQSQLPHDANLDNVINNDAQWQPRDGAVRPQGDSADHGSLAPLWEQR
jgi:hypothetical protein